MADFLKGLAILALSVIGVIVVFAMIVAFNWWAILLILGLSAAYGWMMYAFYYYRFCRREELLYLLGHAAETSMPLAPALRAYLHDRPRGQLRDFWVGTILCLLPLPGFYWIWYRNYNFDRKVDDLARQLELGVPLHHALQVSPALASRETVLAAAIGEATGQLPRCLRAVAGRRLSTIWMELLPQLVYPFAILLVVSSIVGFLSYFIVPKFKRIFHDFGTDLPLISQIFISQSDFVTENWLAILLGLQVTLITVAVLALSSTARWFFPVIGSIYRRLIQSHVMQMLSLLLDTGKPAPESLAMLADLPIGVMARRLIGRARFSIEQGEPLGESLRRAGLLSAAMLPLVQAAERSGNLPWAMAEMAYNLNHRTTRALQRITQAVFPLTVILLGVLVGFIVVSMFLPVVKIITELSV